MSTEQEQRERQYIRALVVLMREQNQEASAAGKRWEVSNAEVNAWLADMNITDPVQVDKIKGANLKLRGLFDKWAFHEREVKRYAATIEAELASRQLLEILP